MVLIVERVKPSLRGEITCSLIESKAGVFVGNVSARVREKLWQHVCAKTGEGAATIVWSADTEQGYQVDFWGDGSRYVHDWDGLQQVKKPK